MSQASVAPAVFSTALGETVSSVLNRNRRLTAENELLEQLVRNVSHEERNFASSYWQYLLTRWTSDEHVEAMFRRVATCLQEEGMLLAEQARRRAEPDSEASRSNRLALFKELSSRTPRQFDAIGFALWSEFAKKHPMLFGDPSHARTMEEFSAEISSDEMEAIRHFTESVNRFSDWVPPSNAETSSEPFVFVDPRDVLAFTLKPGVWKKQLVGAGRVPYLEELVELELALGAEEASHTYQVDVAVYFGLADGCELHVVGGEAYSLNRGHFVTVFPGVFHSAAHAGGRQRCKVLRAVHRSGAFAPSPKKEVEAKRLEDLSSVKTAHESPKLSKRVFIAHGEVPGLFQVSMSRFASGAECETHSHQSAAEVYVNFDGQGCHLEMKGVEAPGQLSMDLSGGKVAVVNPLTSHRAWNSAQAPCHNFNMLLGPPSE